MQSAAFQLHDVHVHYGAHAALHDVTLDVAPGEAVALVGPSGAGKTTLLRLLNGTLRPTQGEVRLNGEPLGDLSNGALRRVRSRIGFVHQDLSLVPNLRVSQNVLAGKLGRVSLLASARLMLRPSKRDLVRAHAILERVGIPEKLFERTDRLSGGQQQRVAIARALFQDPVALLADEPVSSVDPARAKDTVELLTRISCEEDLTLCMSIHDLELARASFGRLVGLRAGRVVFDRPPDKVTEADFGRLYELAPGELLARGA